jgi:hypothetical protein
MLIYNAFLNVCNTILLLQCLYAYKHVHVHIIYLANPHYCEFYVSSKFCYFKS